MLQLSLRKQTEANAENTASTDKTDMTPELTREQIAALPTDQLKRAAMDALREVNAKGVQLPNKKRPRVQQWLLIAAELERRRH